MTAQAMTLEEILKERDKYEIESKEWNIWNEKKAELLESMKPSTKERIIYFLEKDLGGISGVVDASGIPAVDYYVDRRSLLEYHPNQRHPIPYVVIKHEDHYFLILRGSGSGEIRLIGKKGCLGGHVGEEDIVKDSLSRTIENGMKRELHEEAGITDEIIEKTEIMGWIISDEGVDNDHFGIVYQVTLNTRDIQSEEEALKGVWLHKSELEEHKDSFESWLRLVYDKWLC